MNTTLINSYWHVSKKINEHILNNERAEYGKESVSTLATQLVEAFGKSFELKNLYRMMQFSDAFPEIEIVVTRSRQLT